MPYIMIISVLISITSVQTFAPHANTHLYTSYQKRSNAAFLPHAATSKIIHAHHSLSSFVNDDGLSNQRQDHWSKTKTMLAMAKKSTEHLLTKQWLPSIDTSDDDIYASDDQREQLEKESIQHLSTIILKRLQSLKNCNESNGEGKSGSIEEDMKENNTSNLDYIKDLVKGKFRDLTCKVDGEMILEEILINNPPVDIIQSDKNDVVRGAVIALQSLLIMGMQVGVKGSTEHQQKLVSHLYESDDISIASSPSQPSLEIYYNNLTARQLKHQVDTTAGTQVLSTLKRKRSTQSAYDLLVQLGAWEKHEDIALLRSGFPLRFTDEELDAALEAEFGKMTLNGTRIENLDPDQILGLRKDFRSMKVYTIDSQYTSEIDDGLSIEVINKPDGSQRHRVWIHIADADKWGKFQQMNIPSSLLQPKNKMKKVPVLTKVFAVIDCSSTRF